MCVFNDEKYVGNAIQSILDQTYRNFELVIINDGSTDGTVNVLSEYAAKDARIRVVSQQNCGTTVAANTGLSLARGKYIARLDSDDTSYRNRLAIEVDFLNNNPEVALVGGGVHIIDLDGNVIGERNISTARPAHTLMHRCIYQQSDVMFYREVVLGLGGYREKFHNAQDYDLWLRISDVAKIAKLNTILGQWRLNHGGYSLSRAKEQRDEVRVIKRFADQRRRTGRDGYDAYLPLVPAKHRRSIGDAEYGLQVGALMLKAARTGEARAKFKDSLRRNHNSLAFMLYLLTFAPGVVIRLLFRARDYYLNTLV